MKINLAKNAGFCGGVQRAFDLVKNNFSDVVGGRVFIWGSLAHNKTVAHEVASWGIETVNSFDGLGQGDILIVTAHGMGKGFYQEAKKLGIDVFDTTCPKVKRIHKLVEDYSRKGFFVIIFGDKDHKEVIGIDGWVEKQGADQSKVVFSVEELNDFLKNKQKSDFLPGIIIVSQTTQKQLSYEKIVDELTEFCEENEVNLLVENTICVATSQRQPEAKKVSMQSDAVVVIGGKDSSNTAKLYEIAKEELGDSRVIWIEELTGEKEALTEFVKGKESVGILSGASTPKKDIERVVSFILGLEKID